VLEVPVIGADAPNWSPPATRGIRRCAPQDLDAAISKQTVDVALSIDADYGKHWREGTRPDRIVADSTRKAADIPTARLRSALEAPRPGRNVAPARARHRSGHHPAAEHRQRDLASAEASAVPLPPRCCRTC
jgi:sodium transport system permease protein